MRIVDRKTFLALPAGTLYQKYQPSMMTGLCIKQDSVGGPEPFDFRYVDVVNTSFTGVSDTSSYIQACDEMATGEPRHVEFSESRDGLFDQDQLFAIWEPYDIKALRDLLDRQLPK